MNVENKDLILATLSLPSFKADFIPDDADEDFAFAKQLLISECKKYETTRQNEPVNVNRTNSHHFIRSFSSRRGRTSSIECEIEADIMKYFAETDNSINILNKYPLIREVYLKYNTTLSSSAPVERVFSQSLLIFTPHRNRISDGNFEKTLFIKINRKFLVKYAEEQEAI